MLLSPSFKESVEFREKFSGVAFKNISVEEREGLEIAFSREQGMKGVWELDGGKIPGLDGLKFKFIQ